ncbi:hypothetical protein E1283_29090 [Streptomyces hainanensis]|uniref:Uncharacterized protein n=1 Tax=Streptomyces hainanensis TaxID=402648 RepID=A0A4R4SYA0_9ACTN|nr:hypothetical protein E1283_29090 [Streptomyces hainanensis]
MPHGSNSAARSTRPADPGGHGNRPPAGPAGGEACGRRARRAPASGRSGHRADDVRRDVLGRRARVLAEDEPGRARRARVEQVDVEGAGAGAATGGHLAGGAVRPGRSRGAGGEAGGGAGVLVVGRQRAHVLGAGDVLDVTAAALCRRRGGAGHEDDGGRHREDSGASHYTSRESCASASSGVGGSRHTLVSAPGGRQAHGRDHVKLAPGA